MTVKRELLTPNDWARIALREAANEDDPIKSKARLADSRKFKELALYIESLENDLFEARGKLIITENKLNTGLNSGPK